MEVTMIDLDNITIHEDRLLRGLAHLKIESVNVVTGEITLSREGGGVLYHLLDPDLACSLLTIRRQRLENKDA